MMRLCRRRFLSAAGLAAIAVGCGRRAEVDPDSPSDTEEAGPGPFAGRELRVYVGAGRERAMREAFVPALQRRSGAKATLLSGPAADGVRKLRDAKGKAPPIDLLLTDGVLGRRAAREGLFARLDRGNVPNHKSIAPALLKDWVFEEGHGVPFPEWVLALAYDRKRAPRAPRTWSDLLIGAWAGQLALCRSFETSLFTFACIRASESRQRWKTAWNVLEKGDGVAMKDAHNTRDRVKLWWTTPAEMIASLTDGKCVAGAVPSTDLFAALRDNRQLAAVVPDEDRACGQAIWCVAAGGANRDVAENAVNVYFSEEVQLALARRGWPTALPGVAEKVAREDALWKQLNPHTEEQLGTLRHLPYDFYEKHRERIADEWRRTVLGE
jgi:spermidine/putrescine-binding protein